MAVRGPGSRTVATALAVASLLASGCGAAADVTQPTNPSRMPPIPTPPPFTVPSPPPPAPVTDACPEGPPSPVVVDPATLSTTELAGLVLAVGIPHATAASDPEAAAAVDVGVGAVVLKRVNIASVDQARGLVEDMAAASPLGLLFLVDHEGGRVAHADAVVPTTPSARRLGREGHDAAAAAGATIGTALRGAGIHMNLAPVADLDDGAWDGIIGDRSFGATAEEVTAGAEGFLAGLHQRGTMTVAKHFPGYAGAEDTHSRTARSDVDRATLLREHLAPFRALADAGVDAIMLSHVDYAHLGGELPASLDPAVYALLREEGFHGVAMTDSLGMGPAQAQGGHAGAAVRALAAGADMLLANQGSEAARTMRDAIVEAVEAGDLPAERLREAAGRVMRLRARQAVIAAGCR